METLKRDWNRAVARLIAGFGSPTDVVNASANWLTVPAAPDALVALASLSSSDLVEIRKEEMYALIDQVYSGTGGRPPEDEIILTAALSLLYPGQDDRQVLETARLLAQISRSYPSLSQIMVRFDSGLDYYDDGLSGALGSLREDIEDLRRELTDRHPVLE